MSLLRTTCLLLAACLVAPAASYAGAIVVAEEHTFSFGPGGAFESTPWATTFDVPLYNGSLPLAEVMITLNGTAESDLDITATGGDVTVLVGEVGAFINANSPGVGLDINAIPNGVFAPPAIVVPGGTTESLVDVSGSDADMDTFTGSPAVDPYVGVGTFPVDVSAIGTQTLTTSGGNQDSSQTTVATATLTVQYKVMIPEPTSLSLVALGLAGAFIRRRV